MTTETRTLSTNGEAALAYADRGWRVFPVFEMLEDGTCACGNPECPEERWGKHPRISEWQRNATTDHEQIREWWSRWPDANIGCLTGKASGIVVIDVDIPEGHPEKPDGTTSIETFIEDVGELPATATVRTGSGGLHYYFLYPDAEVDLRNRTDALPGVDVRGNGGYVLVPPSNHKSGGHYEWV